MAKKSRDELRMKRRNEEDNMAQDGPSGSSDPLENAIIRLGEGSRFLWIIFIFTMTPTMFNGMHSMSYVFIAEVPTHWCRIDTLNAAGWTGEQIRNISSATPCTYYDYDYKKIAEMGFEAALQYKAENKVPELACTVRDYLHDTHATSIVEEWDLTCERMAHRSNTHMALSLGKLLGSTFFGSLSDKFGRKVSYVIGIIMLILSGPTSGIVPWYWGFMILRFLSGASHAATQYSSLTTLTEVAGEKNRRWMGVAYNIGYTSGTALIAGLSYCLSTWNQIQIFSSLPAVYLLVQIWYMPESPPWLISKNRHPEAYKIVESALKRIPDYPPLPPVEEIISRRDEAKEAAAQESSPEVIKGALHTLVTEAEMGKRLFISNFTWFTASLSYYALALNVDNFAANRFVYVSVMGLTEIPAYLVPFVALKYFGRRTAVGAFYFMGAVALLSILLMPTNFIQLIWVIALVGRFTVSAGYAMMILYTSELFPTVCRNSAVGWNSAVSHVGSIAAPYVADLLGAIFWWAPSTLCGAFALASAYMIFMLPETKNRPLMHTVAQEVGGGRENVSFFRPWRLGRLGRRN